MFKKHSPLFMQLWTMVYGVTFLSIMISVNHQISKFQDKNVLYYYFPRDILLKGNHYFNFKNKYVTKNTPCHNCQVAYFPCSSCPIGLLTLLFATVTATATVT